ncbi:MAG TPA: phosphoglycerate kinase [Candidatus Tumulicola sp.]
MALRSVNDLDVRGERVLVREDLNVPMDGTRVADFTRIDAAIPTLRWLHDNGARTIVLSHLGRPDGKADPRYSLRPVAQALSQRLNLPVAFADDCVGPHAERAAAALHDGDILLLENVRFHPEEERDDPKFVAELARLGDAYVNDAFGTAHRAHASTEGLAHALPHAAGFLMESELDALRHLTDHPAKPYVCAIGGSKVADKIGVFAHLIGLVDAFCVGGGMANTFLAAQGVHVGKSLRDNDLQPARDIITLAQQRGVALHLPIDAVVGTSLDDPSPRTIAVVALGADDMILDIGPATAKAYAGVIANAKTIVFNGPMGVYEKPAYRAGTRVVGEAIVRATRDGALSVVGGGDAAAAAHMLGFADGVSHVSTGGGATLEYLEGRELPGVAALES